MKNDPESFEVTEYSDPPMNLGDVSKVVKQIVADMKDDDELDLSPAQGITVSVFGDKLRLNYHCLEVAVHIGNKITELETAADKILNQAVKKIKSEFKKRTKKVLDLSEDKKTRDMTVQKVSLNERYHVVFWRNYSTTTGTK